MVILKLTLSLLSIVAIIVYFIFKSRVKNYAQNLYYKRLGIKCYGCPDTIITDEEQVWDLVRKDNENNFSECVRCHRNSRLSLLMNFSHFKGSFDKLILNRSFERGSIFVVFLPLICLIISLFLNNKGFSDFSSMFNSITIIIYWSVNLYRVWLCRR